MGKAPRYILPLIVLSQFAGTSLWFAGNAILEDIRQSLQLGSGALGNITSMVQFGFIAGTLVFAILSIADRFSPSKVFFVSSLLAALSNLSIALIVKDQGGLLFCRFLTGFFLAGIYPVGMKIASDWYETSLGKALGWLVGALVLGTAFPYLLKGLSLHFSWQGIIWFISVFAFLGGILILAFVKDGPGRKKGQSFHPKNAAIIFQSRDFRSAALGYFGHMWELYAFWAFVPIIIGIHNNFVKTNSNVSLVSFYIIGIGSLSCIIGGLLSQKWGSARIAFYSMLFSACCCLLSFLFVIASTWIFIAFMIIWGITVISDSPQFSALVAQTAPPEYKGTALTLVTCIGFAITIGSIQLLNYLSNHVAAGNAKNIFVWLAPGPLIGLFFLYRLARKKFRQFA